MKLSFSMINEVFVSGLLLAFLLCCWKNRVVRAAYTGYILVFCCVSINALPNLKGLMLEQMQREGTAGFGTEFVDKIILGYDASLQITLWLLGFFVAVLCLLAVLKLPFFLQFMGRITAALSVLWIILFLGLTFATFPKFFDLGSHIFLLIICEMPLLHLPVAVRNTVESVMEHRLKKAAAAL